MERMKVTETIVYGGAFNPPTLAHQAILRACIEYAEPREAEVWVLPSGDRLDKTIATPRERRLAYLDAMIGDTVVDTTVPVVVSELELNRPIAIETYDTLREFQQEYPNRSFTFVFGADSTQTMAEWQHGDELLEELSMLVVEREGCAVNPIARHAVRLNIQTPNVSSTQVRSRIAEGQPINDLVPASVAALF